MKKSEFRPFVSSFAKGKTPFQKWLKMLGFFTLFWVVGGSGAQATTKYCFCHNYDQGPSGQTQCVSVNSLDELSATAHAAHVLCNDCEIDASSHPDCNSGSDPILPCSVRDTRGKCTGCGNGLIDNEPDCCNPNVQDCTGIDNLCENCDDANNQDGDGCSEDCQKECVGAAGCNDGNECTDDSCNGATGLCVNTPKSAGSACNDSNACTGPDACLANGTCSGAPVICSPLDNCHEAGVCDPETGQCSNPTKADGSPCPDENLCNGNEACLAGVCSPGVPTICSDGNICTDDSVCSPLNGLCTYTPNTNPCDDGNVCTQNDQCSNGDCDPGMIKSCDDQNICTIDTCEPENNELDPEDPEAGCVHTNDNQVTVPCYTGPEGTENVGICDGGNYECFDGVLGDVCVGEVTPETEICDGLDNDCDEQIDEGGDALCIDANVCNGAEVCAGLSGCQDGPDLNCDDQNECTSDSCDPIDGCKHDPTNTGTQECGVGACKVTVDNCENGQPKICVPESPSPEICNGIDDDCDGIIDNGGNALCEDNNVCTDNICDGAEGCKFPNNTSSCNDGNLCTENDICGNGQCAGEAKICNDSISCTVDACNEANGNCEFDNSACECETAQDCPDDGNPCTDVICNAQKQCEELNDNTNSCNDGLFCNGNESCSEGDCLHSGNPCQNGTECADACNEEANNCFDAQGTVCADDGNVCTNNICDGNGACVAQNNTNVCSDGDACTVNDVCSNGLCIGAVVVCADTLDCTEDSCDSETGECVFEKTAACECETAADCPDDGNPCTDVICNAQKQCEEVNDNTNSCNDGLFCNGTESCVEGGCLSSGNPCLEGTECGDACNEEANNCFDPQGTVCTDDGNVCTNNVCDGNGACVAQNNTNSCNDGNLCTENDLCGNGQCAGTLKDCSDGLICTMDSCDQETGACQHNTSQCICSTDEDCNDNNPCTEDKCPFEFSDFCENTPTAGKACDDTNLCTVGDACSEDGTCIAGSAKNCDDENPCTDDSCQLEDGSCLNVDNGTCQACPDADQDGVCDENDNCVNTLNPKQEDQDVDGVGDVCDNCPQAFNPSQNPNECLAIEGAGNKGGTSCSLNLGDAETSNKSLIALLGLGLWALVVRRKSAVDESGRS